MLMISPGAIKRLRGGLASYLQLHAKPVTLAGHREKRQVRKVNDRYRRKLIDQTAAIMRQGEPSVFAFEGFMRHGLRSGLCLRGWSWSDADDMAADIVRSALSQIGALHPTWRQGQPEWAQNGFNLIDHVRCVRCGERLSRFNFKFCSKRCSWAYHASRAFEAKAVEAVYDDAP